MAIPTSTVAAQTNYVVNQIDPSVSSVSISSGGTSSSLFSYAGANKLEVLLAIGGTTGAANGTIQFTWNVLEPTSGSVISTYAGSNLTGAGVDHIGIYTAGTILGAYGFLSWATTGAANATWNPVYARILAYP